MSKNSQSSFRIAYVVSDLRRVGPTNQTLNIIKHSPYKDASIVITLFDEPQDSMKEDFQNAGIKVVCLHLNRHLYFLNGKSALSRVLQSYNINLVHSYGTKPDPLCQKVCAKLDIPHIITLRNYPKEDLLKRMNFFAGHLAVHSVIKTIKHAKYLVACSQAIADKLKKDYPALQLTVIQNGVDTEKFHPVSKSKKLAIRKKLGLPQNEQIYLSTGLFIKRKHIEESIDGFLKAGLEDASLVLLGDGELYNTISQKYRQHQNIIFRGRVSNVDEYLQAADYFISSSESEGLPNSVIEAVASGLPVILSDIPQHQEVLDTAPNSGLTYRLGDISDLANKINDIQTYDNSKSDIAKSNLTMSAMSTRYARYYENILKGAL